MPIPIRVPTPLRKLTGNQAEVQIDGDTIASILTNLETAYPGMKERLCDEAGQVRRFINIYVNEEDIRFLQGVETSLKQGDKIAIIPAIAGGSGIRASV